MSGELAKQTYDLICSFAKVMGQESYFRLRVTNGGVYMVAGNIRLSTTYKLIKVGDYRTEDMLQTRDEFISCLRDHCARLENIRAEVAAALPQPIAEEFAENFTILPALIQSILMANHYKFQRDDRYSNSRERWANTSCCCAE